MLSRDRKRRKAKKRGTKHAANTRARRNCVEALPLLPQARSKDLPASREPADLSSPFSFLSARNLSPSRLSALSVGTLLARTRPAYSPLAAEFFSAEAL